MLRGYTAVVDPAAFGWHTEVVDLYCDGRMPGEAIKRVVKKEPAVVSARHRRTPARCDAARDGRGHAAPGADARADQEGRRSGLTVTEVVLSTLFER